MIIRTVLTTQREVVMDGSHLCELLHPYRDPAKVPLGYCISHAFICPGDRSCPHRLKNSSEVYYILSGTGRIHVGEDESMVSSGTLVYIPPGEVQSMENCGEDDLTFLVIVEPPWTADDEECIPEGERS
jgi:mannose-6-phosphate isomerase-like protein (cupin superfamily)